MLKIRKQNGKYMVLVKKCGNVNKRRVINKCTFRKADVKTARESTEARQTAELDAWEYVTSVFGITAVLGIIGDQDDIWLNYQKCIEKRRC